MLKEKVGGQAVRGKVKFDIIESGEWIEPVRSGYKLVCCDCGLVHRIDFRVWKRRIQFRLFRDNRSTGQKRRWMKQATNVTLG